MKQLLPAALAAALLAAAFAGCGDDKPKTEADKVKQTVKDYAGDIADGDVDDACGRTAGELAKTCSKDLARVATNLEDAKIFADNTEQLIEDKDVRIRGNLACIPASAQSFDLQKIDDEWKLIAIGRRLEDRNNCLTGLTAAPAS